MVNSLEKKTEPIGQKTVKASKGTKDQFDFANKFFDRVYFPG
jgi:hypothetical protein